MWPLGKARCPRGMPTPIGPWCIVSGSRRGGVSRNYYHRIVSFKRIRDPAFGPVAKRDSQVLGGRDKRNLYYEHQDFLLTIYPEPLLGTGGPTTLRTPRALGGVTTGQGCTDWSGPEAETNLSGPLGRNGPHSGCWANQTHIRFRRHDSKHCRAFAAVSKSVDNALC